MLGIQMYTVRTLLNSEAECDSTVLKLKEIGYDCIQLAGGEAAFDTMRYSAKAAKKYGLKVIGILSNTDALNCHFDELIKIARDADCIDIGISGSAKSAEAADELVKSANELGRAVRAEGFSFSYHNHSHEFIRTKNGKTVMDILLSGFDSQLVDLMPDTYWLQHGGADVRSFIETYSDRIKLLHLKDMKRVEEGVTFSEVGEGNLNMPGIINTAKASGIDTFIVEQDMCDGDPLKSAEISYNNLKKIMQVI
jgi:sugar phosphate isomerase/epimerase